MGLAEVPPLSLALQRGTRVVDLFEWRIYGFLYRGVYKSSYLGAQSPDQGIKDPLGPEREQPQI